MAKRYTEVTTEHGYFESTKYQKTKIYDHMGKVVAEGTGAIGKKDSVGNAWKDLREKKGGLI